MTEHAGGSIHSVDETEAIADGGPKFPSLNSG